MKKAFACLSMLLISAFCSTGCADLGYPDDEHYFTSYGSTVYVVYANEELTSVSTTSYDFNEYFYNEKDYEDFSGNHVEMAYYTYLYVQYQGEDATFEELAIFLKGLNEESLNVNVYYTEALPNFSYTKAYNAPLVDEKSQPIIYQDDLLGEPLSSKTKYKLNATTFEDCFFETYLINGEEKTRFNMKKDGYLVFQFRNNTGMGKDEGLKPVKLQMCNLHICMYS